MLRHRKCKGTKEAIVKLMKGTNIFSAVWVMLLIYFLKSDKSICSMTEWPAVTSTVHLNVSLHVWLVKELFIYVMQ